MVQKRNRERINLHNGNSFTIPYITPDNWESRKAGLKKKWFVRFTYYDCINRPNGMSVKWEKTINNFKTLSERQEEARRVLEMVLRDLKAGVNPVVGNNFIPSNPIVGETSKHEFLSPSTPFKKCIEWAFEQFPDTPTKMDMQTYLFHIRPALAMTRYEKMPIGDVTPQHIAMVLSAAGNVTSRWCEKEKKQTPLTWSNYKYNKCLAYFSMMLSKVLDLRIIATNPCHGLPGKTWEKKTKKALLPNELTAIDEQLKIKPDYRRFIMIFHASGSRMTEMMKLQMKDVHLDQYCFYRWVLKRKGRVVSQVRTTIPQSVIHLWGEQLAMCQSPDDYLFGRLFKPKHKPISVRAVQAYWKMLVQEPLGVEQGVYVLKHMYLTALKKKYGSETAAGHAAHLSTDMVNNIYDLDKEESQHERIKNANVHFVPQKRLASTEKCQPISFTFPR